MRCIRLHTSTDGCETTPTPFVVPLSFLATGCILPQPFDTVLSVADSPVTATVLSSKLSRDAEAAWPVV
jgi:hypothetical protein